jgi:hypothetical protein
MEERSDSQEPAAIRSKKNFFLVVRSGGRMIKPCGLVCCVAYPYALAILCPVASVALLSPHRSLLPASSLFPPLLPSPAEIRLT